MIATNALQFRENYIFDVGMHRGEDTEFYLKKGFHVIGFEADPVLISCCKEKFASEIQSGLLTIVEGAIAPAEFGESVRFHSSSNSVWGTIDDDWVDRNEKRGAQTRRLTLARIDMRRAFEQFGVPFFIKIDIEGMDVAVLQVISSLPVKPKYIFIESEKASFEKLVSEMALLRTCGYGLFKVVQQKDIPGKRIETLDSNGNLLEHVFPIHSSGPFGEDVMEKWIGHDDAVDAYKKIFDDYRRSGDQAKIHMAENSSPTILSDPGWYDTHAKLLDFRCDKGSIVSVIVTCKNRLEHLKVSLPKLVRQSDIDIIVVDYGCAQNSGEWVRDHYSSVHVVTVVDDPVFSLSRARNIGALHAKTDYLMFLDADTLVDFDISAWIRLNVKNNECFTVDSRSDPSLFGVLLVGRLDFLNVGRYDEAYRGWGWDDIELYSRLEKSGVKLLVISAMNIASIPHDDAIRHFSVSDGGSSSKERAMVAGFLYKKIKADMQDQGLANIGVKGRASLMADIRRFTEDLFASGQSGSPFDLNIDSGQGFIEKTKITYHVKTGF